MYVYWRNAAGKLSTMEADLDDHYDAILAVQDSLLETGEGWNDPMLVLIPGGKQ